MKETNLEQKLLDSGYKKDVAKFGNHIFHSTNIAFYKWKYGKDGEKLYQLLCYWYDRKFLNEQIQNSNMEDVSLSWELQFNLPKDEVFDVTYSTNNIEDAESFFEKIFEKMECISYQRS